MRLPHKVQFAAILALALMAPACARETAEAGGNACPAIVEQLDPNLAAKIDPIVNSALERGFAGGVVVMRDGAVIYHRYAGSSSLTEDIPITAETLFHTASTSKYLTAALVLNAAEEGVIDLSASIESLAPKTRLAARGVTFMDLLAHRSGLGSSYVSEEETTGDGALAAIDAEEFDEARAGTYRYSNDGYDVLGILLERVYEKPYEALVREKIFSPFCLDRPRIWSEVDVSDPHIVSQPLRPVPESLRGRNYGLIASGGLLISALDLVRYQEALTSGALLSDASLGLLYAPRGVSRIGDVAFGSFIIDAGALGRRIRAGGAEDWGDNAILNHYRDHGIIVAVVTSRGPAENTNQPLFRDEISQAIEEVFAVEAGAE